MSIGSEKNLIVEDFISYAFLILYAIELLILYYLIKTFLRIEKKVNRLLRKQQKEKKKK
jgi:hypothetical protein